MKGLKPKNKKAFAFGSYGWKPGVVNQIQKVYEDLGWETIPPFEEKYTPKSDVVERLKEHVKTMTVKRFKTKKSPSSKGLFLFATIPKNRYSSFQA